MATYNYYSKYGTEPQRILTSYLYDTKHVLSSFDMNKIASLTFGNDANCNEIFDVLEKTLSNPFECSVLTIHKTIRSVHHIIIYGHDRVINLIQQRLRHHIGRLTSYNTALQQQHQHQQSKFKIGSGGGTVDKGEPVRTAATDLYNTILIKPMSYIQQIREKSADPTSLVPIGTKNDTLGYQSEEYLSRPESERMANVLQQAPKSNLVKGQSGYGGGTHLRDANGKVIIGAAHSIEEMMQVAAMKDKKVSTYSDDPNVQRAQGAGDAFKSGNTTQSLDSSYTRQMMAPDLLDFAFTGSSTAKTTSSNNDPFSSASNEIKLQQELEKQQRELEELRKKLSTTQQAPTQLPQVALEPSFVTIPEETQPKSAADVISSLDNLSSYDNNNYSNTMTAPTACYSVPSQPQLNNNTMPTINPGYNAPPQPQLNINAMTAPALSNNEPPQPQPYNTETPIAFDSTPEANFQFQIPMGGSEPMGGGMSAPKRDLHSGQSSGLGNIPLPPSSDMPPPPPDMPPPPPANVSYNSNTKEDDLSSLHSTNNVTQQQLQPQQHQLQQPQQQSMMMANPQMMMMPQQQQQQHMMMMTNQQPQQMITNPMMMMNNPMQSQMMMANPQMMMNPQQQMMMMNPQQQQHQQMMMMNQQNPQQNSMMMNSMHVSNNPQQSQQQNARHMSNNPQQQQPLPQHQQMMVGNPQMMMMNPQQHQQMMMMNPHQQQQQQQQSYQLQQQSPY